MITQDRIIRRVNTFFKGIRTHEEDERANPASPVGDERRMNIIHSSETTPRNLNAVKTAGVGDAPRRKTVFARRNKAKGIL